MPPKPWYRKTAFLLLAGLLFPPLGIILLIARGDLGILTRIFGSLLLVAVGVVHIFYVYGMRVEMDGTGSRPIFSFGTKASHYNEIERSRARQREAAEAKAVPAPEIAPAVVAAATPEPATAAPAKEKADDYWSDFRGPGRAGVYAQTPILAPWPPNGLPRLWKQPVGGGYASVSIANGVAFTIEQRRAREVVAAYDLRNGRELWTNEWEAFFQESMGGDGPRATPVWLDGKVYTQGAEGEFRCLDAATGKVIWNKNILRDNGTQNIQWGMANSPLLVDGKVIVTPGGSGGRSVVAYDKDTGQRVWGALDDKASYTSPSLVTLAGKRQILAVTASRAVGLTVEDGKLLWEYPWTTAYDINSAQPLVVGENRFFISAGYGHGAAVVEVVPKGAGFQAKEIWSNNRMKNKFNASVLYEGHVYGLDEGILACVDVNTGDQKWKGGRYGYGQLLLAGGHLVVTTESGDLVLVKATPQKHEEISRFSAISGKTWNNPAMSNGLLVVRNTTEMACFRIQP